MAISTKTGSIIEGKHVPKVMPFSSDLDLRFISWFHSAYYAVAYTSEHGGDIYISYNGYDWRKLSNFNFGGAVTRISIYKNYLIIITYKGDMFAAGPGGSRPRDMNVPYIGSVNDEIFEYNDRLFINRVREGKLYELIADNRNIKATAIATYAPSELITDIDYNTATILFNDTLIVISPTNKDMSSNTLASKAAKITYIKSITGTPTVQQEVHLVSGMDFRVDEFLLKKKNYGSYISQDYSFKHLSYKNNIGVPLHFVNESSNLHTIHILNSIDNLQNHTIFDLSTLGASGDFGFAGFLNGKYHIQFYNNTTFETFDFTTWENISDSSDYKTFNTIWDVGQNIVYGVNNKNQILMASEFAGEDYWDETYALNNNEDIVSTYNDMIFYCTNANSKCLAYMEIIGYNEETHNTLYSSNTLSKESLNPITTCMHNFIIILGSEKVAIIL